MRAMVRAVLLAAAAGSAAAFGTTWLDPRTPWWGHLAFGLPALPAAAGWLWMVRHGK